MPIAPVAPTSATLGGEVGEPAAVEDVIGGEGADPARAAIDADARAHPERMALDPRLELLVAIVREPHRPTGKEHRGQGDVEREDRMIVTVETPADMGEMRVDPGRPERPAAAAEEIGDRLDGFLRRLNADHELERPPVAVIPAETGFRLEKHRVDRLRLEFAVQHQLVRMARGKLGADLLAVERGPCIGGSVPVARHPNGNVLLPEPTRRRPAGLYRRGYVRRLGRRAGNAHELMRTVRRDPRGPVSRPYVTQVGSRNAKRA